MIGSTLLPGITISETAEIGSGMVGDKDVPIEKNWMGNRAI